MKKISLIFVLCFMASLVMANDKYEKAMLKNIKQDAL